MAALFQTVLGSAVVRTVRIVHRRCCCDARWPADSVVRPLEQRACRRGWPHESLGLEGGIVPQTMFKTRQRHEEGLRVHGC